MFFSSNRRARKRVHHIGNASENAVPNLGNCRESAACPGNICRRERRQARLSPRSGERGRGLAMQRRAGYDPKRITDEGAMSIARRSLGSYDKKGILNATEQLAGVLNTTGKSSGK